MLYSHPQFTAGPIVNNTAPLTLRPTHCLPSQCRTHRSASTPVLNRDKDDEVELGAATLGCALCGGETKRELRERGVGKAGSRPLGRGRRHHSAGSDGGLGWDCRGSGEEMPTSLRRLGLQVLSKQSTDFHTTRRYAASLTRSPSITLPPPCIQALASAPVTSLLRLLNLSLQESNILVASPSFIRCS